MPFGGALTMGAISAGTSIFGGLIKSNAAKNAAKIAQQAGNDARSDVNNATAQVNPQITEAARNAGYGVTGAAHDAGTGVTDAAAAAGELVRNSSGQAANDVNNAAADANTRLDPYAATGGMANGRLSDLLSPGGGLDKRFTAADMHNGGDDGFDFRLQQGQQALDRAMAARGGGQGGGAVRATVGYAQGLASDEYGKAFDRFRLQNNDLYDHLNGVAQRGFVASDEQGQNTVRAAKQAGDFNVFGSKYSGDVNTDAAKYTGDVNTNAAVYSGNQNVHAADLTAANILNAAHYSGDTRLGVANVQGASKIAGANAWGDSLTGVGKAATDAIMLRQVGKNPNGTGGYKPPSLDIWNMDQGIKPLPGIGGR